MPRAATFGDESLLVPADRALDVGVMFGVVERTAATPFLVVDVPPGSLALQAWVVLRGRSLVHAMYPMSTTRWCCEVSTVGSSTVTLKVAYVRVASGDDRIDGCIAESIPDGFVNVGSGFGRGGAEGNRINVCVRRCDSGRVVGCVHDPERWYVDLGAPYGEFVQYKPSSRPISTSAVGLASGQWLRSRQPLTSDQLASLSRECCRKSKR